MINFKIGYNMNNFLLNSKNINKSTYIWNMIGSMLNAFQSVIFLMILTRVSDLSDSGIFTIAFADANLFLLIGKYGVRYFQASDVQGNYDFHNYCKTRALTTSIMILVSILYTVITARVIGYSSYKIWIIIWMCLFKVPDAIEDVFYGEYQRKDRLDVASKVWSIRLILTILIFVLALFVTGNLLVSLIVTTIFTTALMMVLLWRTRVLLKVDEAGASLERTDTEKSRSAYALLLDTFPLFLSTFLAFYVLNAPKYAIDALMTDEIQACFGFVAMPVFVVSLLTSMIYNPVIHKMSNCWNSGEMKAFNSEVWKQFMCVVLITLGCILGADLIGIPVLSLLYSTDLKDYKTTLIILLAGGGFYAACNWLYAVLTIMRKQNYMLIGYILISILALLYMNLITRKFGVEGVSYLFSGLMALLMLICFLIYFIAYRRKKHE